MTIPTYTRTLTLYLQEWPSKNFSLQNQYNVKQMSGENKEKYQLKITSWSNTKFSKLTLSELYGRQ